LLFLSKPDIFFVQLSSIRHMPKAYMLICYFLPNRRLNLALLKLIKIFSLCKYLDLVILKNKFGDVNCNFIPLKKERK
jgi:hypothetical protein